MGEYNSTTSSHAVTLTMPNIGAYVSGDCLGNVITFSGGGLGGGIIDTLTVIDLDNRRAEIDIIFFRAEPSALPADNAAFALQSGDDIKLIGFTKVLGSDYIQLGSTAAIATVRDAVGQFETTFDGNLYARAVIRGSATYVNGLRFIIGRTR